MKSHRLVYSSMLLACTFVMGCDARKDAGGAPPDTPEPATATAPAVDVAGGAGGTSQGEDASASAPAPEPLEHGSEYALLLGHSGKDAKTVWGELQELVDGLGVVLEGYALDETDADCNLIRYLHVDDTHVVRRRDKIKTGDCRKFVSGERKLPDTIQPWETFSSRNKGKYTLKFKGQSETDYNSKVSTLEGEKSPCFTPDSKYEFDVPEPGSAGKPSGSFDLKWEERDDSTCTWPSPDSDPSAWSELAPLDVLDDNFAPASLASRGRCAVALVYEAKFEKDGAEVELTSTLWLRGGVIVVAELSVKVEKTSASERHAIFRAVKAKVAKDGHTILDPQSKTELLDTLASKEEKERLCTAPEWVLAP